MKATGKMHKIIAQFECIKFLLLVQVCDGKTNAFPPFVVQ